MIDNLRNRLWTAATMKLGVKMLFVTILLSVESACAQWMVHNDHDEPFTIQVWNDNDPGSVGFAKIPANQTRPVPLFRDAHRIQAASEGGYVYYFRPRNLNGQSTDLSVLITPDRKRNGVQVYKYMNQQGFKESDYSGEFDEISRSSWDSTYRIIDSTRNADAILNFRRGRGDYGSKGKLSNIRYRRADQDNAFFIDGMWHFGNQQGKFEFEVVNGDRFDGHYSYNNQQYDWNGSRRQE